MVLRVSPSMMSLSRDCAVRSSRIRWKNRSGSEMRQRAKVSTQMYFLSRVGIWFGSPDHSSQRFSKRLIRSANGTLKWRPGSVIGLAARLAEAGDDRLLGLVERVDGAAGEQRRAEERQDGEAGHRLAPWTAAASAPFDSRGSMRRMGVIPLAASSRITFCPARGSTSATVSR